MPATTIAWRMFHLIIGCFGARTAAHFGGPPMDYASYDYRGGAEIALLRDLYRWKK